jgi:hypothetical protein
MLKTLKNLARRDDWKDISLRPSQKKAGPGSAKAKVVN